MSKNIRSAKVSNDSFLCVCQSFLMTFLVSSAYRYL